MQCLFIFRQNDSLAFSIFGIEPTKTLVLNVTCTEGAGKIGKQSCLQ